jgi:S1-C subfamily serine protease
MALIPPFFLDCVTAVGARSGEKDVAFFATSFLYGRLHEKGKEAKDTSYRVYLVTNRHVFEDKSTAVLRFNPSAGAPAKTYDVPLVDEHKKPLWSVHPRKEIDAAAIPINISLLREEGIEFSFFLSDHHVMTQELATSEGLSEGDNLFVLGFPLGEVGKERSYVIVRHGVVARVRDFLTGASDWILADATVFPGNSGGPVVTRPEAMAITGTKSTSNARLLGMVSGYVPYQDVAYSRQTNRPRVMFEENTGISLVVPFTHVTETVEVAYQRQLRGEAKPAS